jgi:hypothetical protein
MIDPANEGDVWDADVEDFETDMGEAREHVPSTGER